jgi:hypothetical protein
MKNTCISLIYSRCLLKESRIIYFFSCNPDGCIQIIVPGFLYLMLLYSLYKFLSSYHQYTLNKEPLITVTRKCNRWTIASRGCGLVNKIAPTEKQIPFLQSISGHWKAPTNRCKNFFFSSLQPSCHVFRNSKFCKRNLFMCYLWTSEQTITYLVYAALSDWSV